MAEPEGGSAEEKALNFVVSALQGSGESLTTKLLTGLFKQSYEWVKGWIESSTSGQKERVAERLRRVLSYYKGTGVEPDSVPLKAVKPWIEKVSVEDSTPLQEMWENLLANAADPRKERRRGHSSFMEIMNHLDTPDVMVLLALYSLQSQSGSATGSESPRYVFYEDDDLKEAFDTIGYERNLTDEELRFAKINLTRLGLCGQQPTIPTVEQEKGGEVVKDVAKGPKAISINEFGQAFYEATRSPDFRNGSHAAEPN